MNSIKTNWTFMCVHKKYICMPVPQFNWNENNDFSTSTSNSSTIQPGPVIEEHVLHVINNQYHVSKSKDEKHRQKDFMERIIYTAKRKTSKQPKAKKSKLTRAQ